MAAGMVAVLVLLVGCGNARHAAVAAQGPTEVPAPAPTAEPTPEDTAGKDFQPRDEV